MAAGGAGVSIGGDGPVTQSPDTSPEAEALLVARWRAMEPWQRIAIVCDLQRAADEAAIVGILERHPAAAAGEIGLRLAALKHGRDFAVKFLGWDPQVHGW